MHIFSSYSKRFFSKTFRLDQRNFYITPDLIFWTSNLKRNLSTTAMRTVWLAIHINAVVASSHRHRISPFLLRDCPHLQDTSQLTGRLLNSAINSRRFRAFMLHCCSLQSSFSKSLLSICSSTNSMLRINVATTD